MSALPDWRAHAPIDVAVTAEPVLAIVADTVVLAQFEQEPRDLGTVAPALAELEASCDARGKHGAVAVTHAEGRRWIVVGLGARAQLDAERAREAAAAALERARELGARVLCWEAPADVDDAVLGGLIEGTLLTAYRVDLFKRPREDDRPQLARLVVSDAADRADVVARAVTIADAQNHARDLQNAPPNVMTPTRLAQRARELADELDGVAVEVLDEAELVRRGMGAFAAVARGSREPAQLIALRYDGPDAAGPLTAWVGKAVTFDSGGISLKRGSTVDEMKFDMSGGAAVIEALGAVARLRLPVRLLAIAGATENMPDGGATRPGDIVRALDGTTIEIINTDAEGRLVLADCLVHAIAEGAEQIVDIATLTGAIVTTFGGRFGGLMSNDDAWAARVEAAGRVSGERVWRLPLDPWFAERLDGRYADVINTRRDEQASTIIAGEFLHRFVGDVPWAHIDTLAWDMQRAYAKEGGAGFGVRLLVELASDLARAPASSPPPDRRDTDRQGA